ncbi:rRNA maturation RNase YbeY [Agaribacterium haliotis]|uniref:rRNA maturation RNase YbeY n=1 Tax=Agaribacterium haliotis TaxID=2013869 RepID=UPI000BB57C89|nr:rRNA maturation RNase YbeY [Agaribacterium haliotis]
MADIDLQIACEAPALPDAAFVERCCSAALDKIGRDGALAVRICEPDEIRQLNRDFRNKDKSTNVLSFPFELPEHIPDELKLELSELGDIVICAAVVADEARAQQKNLNAHWAHMLVHGCLHLCGYDHIDDNEAEQMEALEVQILADLNFANPYETL